MASATWKSNPWLWVISFRRLDVQNAPPMEDLGAKERPILFRGEMVRAILEGRKTQTRRVLKSHLQGAWPERARKPEQACPYGKPEDRLWVRETWLQWACPRHDEGQPPGTRCDCDDPKSLRYLADHQRGTDREIHAVRWRPSIHMPRWACRLVLEVTDVRVERLKDISEEDAKAEGADPWKLPMDVMERTAGPVAYRRAFRSLWESIHG